MDYDCAFLWIAVLLQSVVFLCLDDFVSLVCCFVFMVLCFVVADWFCCVVWCYRWVAWVVLILWQWFGFPVVWVVVDFGVFYFLIAVVVVGWVYMFCGFAVVL